MAALQGHWINPALFIGTMWVNAIRMTVIPLIVPLLIASIAGATSGRDAGRLGLSTYGAFMLMIVILAVISAFAAPFVVQAVLLVASVGFFALALDVGMRVGGTGLTAMGYFIGVAFTVEAIFVTAMFAMVLARGRLSAGTIVKGVAPAIMVAAGTASSLFALPAMIEGARDTWHLPEKIYGFVLPFAVSTFKPTSAFCPISMFFVATLYGIPFGPAQLLIAAAYTIIFNVTVPAISGGARSNGWCAEMTTAAALPATLPGTGQL